MSQAPPLSSGSPNVVPFLLRVLFDVAETVYGLGANALSEEAVLKIFQVRLPAARKTIGRDISTASMSLSF